MMSSNLEHFSVPDKDSTLNDTLLLKIKASSEPSKKTPTEIHYNSFGKVNKTFCRFVIEYIAMSLYFDYWGDHAANHAPCPFNRVLLIGYVLFLKPFTFFLLDFIKTTLGWKAPELKKLFSALTNRKYFFNTFGVKSSWTFQNHAGYTEAIWIHHFFVMQFVHPYFRPRPDMNLQTGLHYNHQKINFLHKKWLLSFSDQLNKIVSRITY